MSLSDIEWIIGIFIAIVSAGAIITKYIKSQFVKWYYEMTNSLDFNKLEKNSPINQVVELLYDLRDEVKHNGREQTKLMIYDETKTKELRRQSLERYIELGGNGIVIEYAKEQGLLK